MLFVSEFSCPVRVWTEFGTKYFFSFSDYLIPFWLKIMPERGFLIFWIFLLFFSEFSSRVEYERNSGLKFFFLFLGLSNLVLAKNNAWKRFFNFLNFFAFFFFQNFLPLVEYERNLGLKFFSPFLNLSHPVLAINNAGKRFFSFFYIFFFFFEIFLPESSMNGIQN